MVCPAASEIGYYGLPLIVIVECHLRSDTGKLFQPAAAALQAVSACIKMSLRLTGRLCEY